MQVTISKTAKPEHLRAYRGETLTVETKHMFADQFNCTVADPEVNNGVRVMEADVSAVIDDVRPQTVKCDYCGNTVIAKDESEANGLAGTACPKCQHKWDTQRTPENEGTHHYTDHIGTLQLLLGPKKPPIMELKLRDYGRNSIDSNISKAAHVIKARKAVEAAARKEAMTLKFMELVPDGLKFKSAQWGNGYYTDGSISINIKQMRDMLGVMELLPPTLAAYAQKKGWAGSIIPAARVEQWSSKEMGNTSWEAQGIGPLTLRVTPYPELGTDVRFSYFTRLGDMIVSVGMDIGDYRVASHHVQNPRYDGSRIVGGTSMLKHPFETATVKRSAGSTEGFSHYILFWGPETSVEEIVNTVPPQKS